VRIKLPERSLARSLRFMPSFVHKNVLLLPLLAAVAVSYTAAFLLRFDFTLTEPVQRTFRQGIGIFLAVKGIVFWSFRLHRGHWRAMGLLDAYRMGVANLYGSALTCVATVTLFGATFPRSVGIIDAALCLLITAGLQMSARLYREVFLPNGRSHKNSRWILIYGAGSAGVMLGKEFRSNTALNTRVAGYIDDDDRKHVGKVMGVPVLGRGKDAPRLIRKLAAAGKHIDEIVIAMPSATAVQMRQAIAHCRAAGVPFKTLPAMSELLSGKISTQIREVSPSDLLGREPVHIDETRIEHVIAGQSVMVTGGCGSIGSELCRQIARFQPRKLVIFDQAESEMFMLALELRRRYPDLNLETEIGDITRAQRVQRAMGRHAVTAVFHAAAYKHVPLMEANIPEAVENNILGTYNVARAAHLHRVKNFVLISSDKAVNPTSIMGVTKRIAELLVAAVPLEGGTKRGSFVSVRFGNVLGSAGSVIPVFQRQIAAGGPVTVTHPEMRRYFMSISEAVQLVLQASSMGQDSEVFVLDMGDPVYIVDLARNMIRLAGLVPDEDIAIQFTGLRPGEKLFEELQLSAENVLPTQHEKVRRLKANAPNPWAMARWLEDLRTLLKTGDPDSLKSHLLRIVPEYQGAAVAQVSQERPRLAAARAS
jgi:FlaA1/EpsC-like NDP-sugar epimerase